LVLFLWQPAAAKPNRHAHNSAAARLQALSLNNECTTTSNYWGEVMD
jgi:hypothetical protein